MLNTFAAKFLTLALVMVALAPLVGNDATQAAPTLMANVEAQEVQPVNEELSLEAAEVQPEEPAPLQEDLPLSAVGPTLKVGTNIEEGGYVVQLGQQGEFTTVSEGLNGNCPIEGPYYTCPVENLAPGGYLVKFIDVEGYTTPSDKPVDLDGFDDLVVGIYEKNGDTPPTDEPGPNLKVAVNIPEGGYVVQLAEQGQFTTVSEGLNATCPVENSYYTCEVKDLAPGGYLVKFKNVEGWTTPSDKPVDLDGIDDLVVGIYEKNAVDDDKVNFAVSTKDDDGNTLHEDYVRNALTTHNTPDSFSEELVNLNNYTFEFEAKSGYTKPGTVEVDNQRVNNLPLGVTILEDGSNYNVGSPFKANSTYAIIGTYSDDGDDDGNLFKVTKSSTEKNLSDGNKEVEYEIKVERADNDVEGTYEIEVDDTVNDNDNKTLYGDNGGKLKVVGNGTCSNGCGDITDGPVTVKTTEPDQTVYLRYTMRSDNSDIPEGETSNFVNTVVGNYEDEEGKDKETTDKETVKVPGDDDGNGNLFSVKKEASEMNLGGGNKQITYTLTVSRNDNGPDGTYYILVDDTINDLGNRTMRGSNGGTLKVVANADGTYGTCSNDCGDITVGPVNVKTTDANDVVTLQYTAVTDVSSVPNNQTSNFVNTVVGKYTQDGETKEPTAQYTVTVGKGTAIVLPQAPTPAAAPMSPTPPVTSKTGPAGTMMMLAASALLAGAWHIFSQRRKVSVTK